MRPIIDGPIFVKYEAEFIKRLYQKNYKSLAVALNTYIQYIDDILLINNCYLRTYVDSIYTGELKIKDTIESVLSVSYLDSSLERDMGGNLKTKFHDKRDDFNLSIVNCPYLCSSISSSNAYDRVLVSRSI